jgi:hypothetical protein
MDEREKNQGAQVSEERLLERLSRLPPFLPRRDAGPGSGEGRRLHDLQELLRRRGGRAVLGGYWDAALISLLLSLLAWDLFRIVRWLLR